MMYPFNATSGDERIVGDAEYIYACKQVLFPVIREFEPDMILISAGFDSALGDPLGGTGVTPTGYAYITWCLRNICPKTTVVLEGGYSLEALERSSEAVVRTLLINPQNTAAFDSLIAELSGQSDLTLAELERNSDRDACESFRETAANLARVHGEFWPVLAHLATD